MPENLQNNYENFPRDKKLTGEDKDIQEASIHKYLSQKDALTDEYLAKHGKVINTDEARKLFSDVGYKGTNAAAVQEASSALGKEAFRRLMKNNSEPDVVLYAGGSGTGKSTAVRNVRSTPYVDEDNAAILDGNLSTLSSARNRIKEIEAAGKIPRVTYVYRDPVDAWENGVVKRMTDNKEEGGRVVPLSVFIGNHEGSYDVVRQLMKEGLDVTPVDNSLGQGNVEIMSMDKFNNIRYDKEKLRSKLEDVTQGLYEQGKITKEQLDALLK